MDKTGVETFVNRLWDESILGELAEYIRIPNKSPAFDPDWRAHGYIEQAVQRLANWVRHQPVDGMVAEVVRLENRSPLIFIDVPGDSSDCVMLYGHLDKQPEMAGWSDDLGPWKPVVRGDRLYGRGAADDGYSTFAIVAAIGALKAQGRPHARCVALIEACEESGSFDLPHYIDYLGDRIGNPSLVIALDSGCANYDQLWCTTSLRGLVGGMLKVEVLTEGVHSGVAGGIVPESFRIARQLLSRIEDEASGRILIPELHVAIPPARLEQAASAAAAIGDSVYRELPLIGDTKPLTPDDLELILNRTWRPALAVIGAEGLPPAANAGNVLRPMTALRLSMRIPPTCNPRTAIRKLEEALLEEPPHGARVTFEGNWGSAGWNAPELAPWLEQSLERASRAYFGKPAAYLGEGGTIPFMGMLGERFPNAQFLITGVLGPHSNAHGPNEFLHIPTAKKLTCCVAEVLADHREAPGSGSGA